MISFIQSVLLLSCACHLTDACLFSALVAPLVGNKVPVPPGSPGSDGEVAEPPQGPMGPPNTGVESPPSLPGQSPSGPAASGPSGTNGQTSGSGGASNQGSGSGGSGSGSGSGSNEGSDSNEGSGSGSNEGSGSGSNEGSGSGSNEGSGSGSNEDNSGGSGGASGSADASPEQNQVNCLFGAANCDRRTARAQARRSQRMRLLNQYRRSHGKKRCFDAESLVLLANGQRTTVKSLKVGDQVLGVNTDTHVITQTQVKQMAVHRYAKDRMLLNITTERGRTFTVTPEHNVFASHRCPSDTNHIQSMSWATFAADDLSHEFCLLSSQSTPGNSAEVLVVDRIRSVHSVPRKQTFQPITELGNILADGVLVSCYDATDLYTRRALHTTDNDNGL